jgi:hypothetical protein
MLDKGKGGLIYVGKVAEKAAYPRVDSEIAFPYTPGKHGLKYLKCRSIPLTLGTLAHFRHFSHWRL